MAARVRSLRFGTLEACLVLALCAAAALVFMLAHATRERERDEARAVEVIERIADAQARLRSARATAAGEPAGGDFGTLVDLEKARLIGDPVVSDDAGPHLEVGGYRVEVLLPGRLERGGRVRWARAGGRVDPGLASQSFAVTAIPRKGADVGLRSFYLDSKGRLYAAEGVQDADRDPSRAPPQFELIGPRAEAGEGPIWRLEDAELTARRAGR